MDDDNVVARSLFVSLVRTFSGGRPDGYSVLNDGYFVKRLVVYDDAYNIDEQATVDLFYRQCEDGTIMDTSQ